MRVVWSPRALSDVQRLYRFLAERNPDAALRAVTTIRNSAIVLSKHPDIGVPMARMDPEFCEWLIGFGANGYALLYRVEDRDITILAIRRQREAGY
jgi:plasmid stabilization system protein ParE